MHNLELATRAGAQTLLQQTAMRKTPLLLRLKYGAKNADAWHRAFSVRNLIGQ
jgi:hypothetical protein